MNDINKKAVSLFKYIRELSLLGQKTVTNMHAEQNFFSLDDIPYDPEYITIYSESTAEFGSTPILSVKKPDFDKCPPPSPLFENWLHKGFDVYKNEVGTFKAAYSEKIPESSPTFYTDSTEILFGKEEELNIEFFEDDGERAEAYKAWKSLRDDWSTIQKKKERTREFFSRLFRIHTELERESEALELTVGNGIFRSKDNEEIIHPLLLKKIKTEFNPASNTIRLVDTESDSYIYSDLLVECGNVNLDAIKAFRDELSEGDYHPLDEEETPSFLERFLYALSPESIFTPLKNEPLRWKEENSFLLSMQPVFFIRKRRDGAPGAIAKIIENIEKTGYIPAHLEDIVSGGMIDLPPEAGARTLEERLAEVGGEDTDILLSKEANREQLEIARRIEQYNAVLVQGPPGTGKTHTIANLLSHFLAEGKSVLISSHTKKALRVLKDKLPPSMQSLCVSLLDDTNEDMERSIDGITDKMSNTTASELKKLLSDASFEREAVISSLAEVRKKLFSAIRSERTELEFNGEYISPSDMASFIYENREELSYIPGDVKHSPSLPLSFTELSELYRSNSLVSKDEESELICDIPSPEEFISPEDFSPLLDRMNSNRETLDFLKEKRDWNVIYDIEGSKILIDSPSFALRITSTSLSALAEASKKLRDLSDIPDWAVTAVIDGQRKGASLARWTSLISMLKTTVEQADKMPPDMFEKEIIIKDGVNRETLTEAIEKLLEKYSKSGKLSIIDKLVLKSQIEVAENVKINGNPIDSKEDCTLVLMKLSLEEKRKRCEKYWDFLFGESKIPPFALLDEEEPERTAITFVPEIEKYLYWFDKEYSSLADSLLLAGISPEEVFKRERLIPDSVHTENILEISKNTLPDVIDVCRAVTNLRIGTLSVLSMQQKLSSGMRINSDICKKMSLALKERDSEGYSEAYSSLSSLYEKYALCEARERALEKISDVAPLWAEAIRLRSGIHGEDRVPANIELAWKWKQYYKVLSPILSTSIDSLHAESLELSRKYRYLTSLCAEHSAWYNLLSRTECDIDMKQALQGWRLTVKKIGKGTGKKARTYKAKARELMAKCQAAVPAWIMPMGKALESLDPKTNRFDILIVDEASQSDISALALTYLAKKLIIVGDDRQVSPMAVGVEIDKTDALENEYIKGIIPNHHLYNAKTSLYDIAATTFCPLMLREHFRCVPDIIGFSNKLSYDGKIKPLRDAGSVSLSPAVVSVRVDGERDGTRKTNKKEAEVIISLLKECIDKKEYAGKTFGVISLLGDEQAKEIQNLIFREIEPSVIDERKILCGNASNFQGDERDVIFLSMVDSSRGTPLPLVSFGVEDSTRKRYNVAVSRAKDQIFIIHSLDPSYDLKPGDIRKNLLDYARFVSEEKEREVELSKENLPPLKAEILSFLDEKHYAYENNIKIGSYTLDTVVSYGKRRVALEFDGKGFGGSEANVSEDMETQTILERTGWHFIRLRGSEYFLDPEKSLEKLSNRLTVFGIFPTMPEEAFEDAEGNGEAEEVEETE